MAQNCWGSSRSTTGVARRERNIDRHVAPDLCGATGDTDERIVAAMVWRGRRKDAGLARRLLEQNGRITVLMPLAERTLRVANCSWAPGIGTVGSHGCESVRPAGRRLPFSRHHPNASRMKDSVWFVQTWATGCALNCCSSLASCAEDCSGEDVMPASACRTILPAPAELGRGPGAHRRASELSRRLSLPSRPGSS